MGKHIGGRSRAGNKLPFGVQHGGPLNKIKFRKFRNKERKSSQRDWMTRIYLKKKIKLVDWRLKKRFSTNKPYGVLDAMLLEFLRIY